MNLIHNLHVLKNYELVRSNSTNKDYYIIKKE